MAIEIKSVGSYLPARIMKNDEWKQYFDTSDEWIYSHTGIKERRIAADNESTADLAVEAAKIALEKAKMRPEDLDMIIVATCTPDYLSFPATANLVQKALGATKAGAFDVHAACTGFVYGLSVAEGFIAAGHGVNNILIIGAEVLSRVINWNDRSTAILFGDGAGAMVVSKTEKSSSLLDSSLHSDGEEKSLIRPAGGVKYPDITNIDDTLLQMDGQAVYQFAVRSLGEVINELLTRNNLTIDDIDYIVPHQANKRIIEAMCSRRKWPLEKVFLNLERTANTSAASIPLALAEMDEQHLLKKGMKIILAGFGAGLTWGGCLVEW